MTSKTLLWVAGVALVAVVAAGGYYFMSGQSAETVAASAPVATPTGITLQFLGRNAQGYAEQDHIVLVLQPDVAYANDKGLTLYTYDKDQPGKSMCTADCVKMFPPAVAAANAKPVGAWSIVARDDGGKQWALDGKPVYTYVKDKLPGETGGNNAGRRDEPGTNYKRGAAAAAAGMGRGAPAVSLPPGAHIAMFKPAADMALPHGIALQNVADANGVVLVDGRGMTLYAYDGQIDRDRPACATPPCPSRWTPVSAPSLANPVGDFTVLSRTDGIKQWAYKGKALYTFDGDIQPSFANGIGADKQWHVASVVQYYMPAGVTTGQTPGRGAVLATAQGMTLYKRDGFAFQSGGGHSFRHGVTNRPAVGRAIGTEKGCDTECLKTWHPFLAPADAQPSGYWEVATRADGSKQWMYQGYALYTYAGDKKPGDMTGNDIYDISLTDDPQKLNNDIGPMMTGTPALYWAVAAP